METSVTVPNQPRGYTSRKFLLCVGLLSLTTSLLFAKLIDPQVWQLTVTTVFLAYMAGNVSQDVLLRWVGNKTP